MPAPLPIAVLVSGQGTTLDGLAEEIDAGRLPAKVVVVVSDRPSAPAVDKARRRGYPTVLLATRGLAPEAWAANLTSELDAHGVELVVLAGFLRVLPPTWVARWRGRAINIHPSLLPRYGGPGMWGHHVLEAVLAAKDAETGVTVHLVTSDLDAGPTITQERVAIVPGDTPDSLRERLHPVEVRLLADTVRRFAERELPLPYPESAASLTTRRDRTRPAR